MKFMKTMQIIQRIMKFIKIQEIDMRITKIMNIKKNQLENYENQ